MEAKHANISRNTGRIPYTVDDFFHYNSKYDIDGNTTNRRINPWFI